MIDDPYKILGVSPDASDEEIKRAYRRLAKQYHPDLNPGDEAAAKKMQQINAAYEQIKNPGSARQSYSGSQGYGSQSYGSQSYGGYGYNPFGSGWQQWGYSQDPGDQYQQSAYQYILYHRYQEALNVLQNSPNRNARWYYLSALANRGIGNQITALEHIRKAVSMEPDNMEYIQTLSRMENGGSAYRQTAGNYRGFSMGIPSCGSLFLCYLLQLFCCRCRCC
jgi:molecular chaperone DnaJ